MSEAKCTCPTRAALENIYGLSKPQSGSSIYYLNRIEELAKSTLSAPCPCETLCAELGHWKNEIGFDTPEEATEAINRRFEAELPKGLAKSLWLLEREECARLSAEKSAATETVVKLSAECDRLRDEHFATLRERNQLRETLAQIGSHHLATLGELRAELAAKDAETQKLRSYNATATETVARLSAECDSLRAELATAQQDYGALMAHAINVYGPCTSVYEALDGMAKVADKRVKELEELARQIAGTDSAYDFAVLRGRAFALLSPAKEAEEGE